MVYQCCVRGCLTVATSGLHSFPTNKTVAEKWIQAIKAANLMDKLNQNKLSRSFHKVCKKHFQQTDFQTNADGKSQLVANSVPSLFLPDDTVYTNPTNVDLLKPLKRRFEQRSSKQLKNQITHENNSSLEVVVLDSMNNVESFENTLVDVNSNTMPKKYETSGRHLKNTVRKYAIRQLSQSAMARNLRGCRRIKEPAKNSKITDDKVLDYLSKKNMNKQQLEFIRMQIENCDKSKHGRRYNFEQKNICLALYKHSPKNYRFMESWWILPTSRTVGRHSADFLFKTGVDLNLLEAIKNEVKDWPENDKYCVISWDETSLKEHLDYSHSHDYIEGFVELAESTKPDFATHALTFMLRGINRPFKQTIGYFYTNGINTFELVELVKVMIGATSTTCLKPILSVCDQASINASTVNTLVNPEQPLKVQTGQLLVYTVNGLKIIHCYDPSHVIKTFRNNLLTKDLAHFILNRWRFGDTTNNTNKSIQIASWDHLIELYEMDLLASQRRLPKLSAEHLKPNKLKMKVSLATQVFSNTCGTVMLQCIEKEQLPNYAGTAQLLLFLNDLFDSLNGSEDHPNDSLKSIVTTNSTHFAFWQYALSILQTMFFVDKTTCDTNNRSSVIQKTSSTIKGYIEFSRLCLELNIPKVSIRNTTQDGLENYFACVKDCSHSLKITPRQYRTGHATMTICNITGKNSLHSNCQQDLSTPILANFHEFIFDCKKQSNDSCTEVSNYMDVNDINVYDPTGDIGEGAFMDVDDMIIYDPELEEKASVLMSVDEMIFFDPVRGEGDVNFLESEAIKYSSSSISQKLSKFTSCEGCKNQLDEIDESTSETLFYQNCKNMLCGLNDIIPHICHEKCLKKKLINHLKSIDTHSIGCAEHDVEMLKKMREFCAEHVILAFCNNINSFLSGKSQILPENHNPIQKLALEFNTKKKRIGKYTDIFN